jgi:hypothetical protein
MFNIVQYKKPKHDQLFEKLSSHYDITSLQNYIPIYSTIFLLNENNYNKITLDTKQNLSTISMETIDEEIHIKYAPIIDPYRFVMGKYSQFSNEDELFCLPTLVKSIPKSQATKPIYKINNTNNSAYVDAFFYYLSTKLIEKYNFVNGVQSFGTFIGIKNNFKFRINDDLDYLIGNKYFLKNSNKLFKVDDYSAIFNEEDDDCSSNRNPKKNKINISNHSFTECDVMNDILDISDYAPNTDVVLCQPVEESDEMTDVNTNFDDSINIDDDADKIECDSDNYEEEYNSNSSEDNDSDSCDDEKDGSGDGDDEKDGSGDEEEDWETESDDVSGDSRNEDKEQDIFVTLDKFPVAMICIEKCKDTLDTLIETNYFTTNEMWYSMLLQIIMSLIVYQKAFTFTHNDLHTNNVMFVETESEFIEYIYNNKKYRIPTFGKIYKIIDFGRSIYKVNEILICSDSYDIKGDANSQYNFEPFYNSNSTRIIPNPSFDLCRLATSMLDFFLESPTKHPDILNLIEEWCQDDKGRNVLYKNNGEERYPEFKLYKMIARTVHRHIPENQLNRSCFSSFITKNKENTKYTVNIDRIPAFFINPII